MKNTITSPIKKAPIQSEGDEVVRSIEENMNPLPVDDLNLAPLEASMNRLMHTIRIYNAIRLLFHFGLMYNSMRFALAKIAAPGRNPASDSDIESFVCNTVAITHQIDVYLALVHLGMADTHVKETYPKLLEACVNMAKPSPKATKA